MLNAITSMLTKTIDVFLKINSSESRRRNFAKDMFGAYKALDEIAHALYGIDSTIKYITGVDQEIFKLFNRVTLPEYLLVNSMSSEGLLEIQTRYLDENGLEKVSQPRKIELNQILPVLLESNIRYFNNAIGKLTQIMKIESWDLFKIQHQPEKLKALEIYDEKLVRKFTNAWFEDGGFVEALFKLGLHQEIDGKVLKLLDAEFNPNSSLFGYEVEPQETIFDLTHTKDVEAFLKHTARCRNTVIEARDAVKQFIASNCAIEDIL
ncbi:hypothetical protein FNW02_24910 [Komarekiella sp. 'clone 1']|uniref:Uncharacterized protein n=1 Tax=Komarekiella delphini-convector SJRDD-AB1 TaxID=2593771 RepID=A0AA40VT96_9NOST|nr:hypothetical protein [Komarekiella delphini-convector]MBD6618972.1 hypothetical protein [Komarekiella delphini-convector SJRDD-AB1]